MCFGWQTIILHLNASIYSLCLSVCQSVCMSLFMCRQYLTHYCIWTVLIMIMNANMQIYYIITTQTCRQSNWVSRVLHTICCFYTFQVSFIPFLSFSLLSPSPVLSLFAFIRTHLSRNEVSIICNSAVLVNTRLIDSYAEWIQFDWQAPAWVCKGCLSVLSGFECNVLTHLIDLWTNFK